MAPEYRVDEDQKIGELVFLKLFHIFIQVISDSNNGSANLQSIIQDYRNNWDGFYTASLPYIEKFMRAAKDLRISSEIFKQKGSYVIRIELPDNWIRGDTGNAGIFDSGTPPKKPDCDIREPDLGYFNGANPEEHMSNAEKDYEKLEKAVEVEQTTLPQSSMEKSETQRSKTISSTGEAELESVLKEPLKNAERENESDESTITEDGAAILQPTKTDNTENGDEEETNEKIEIELQDRVGNQKELDDESKELEGNARSDATPHSSDVELLVVKVSTGVPEEKPQQSSDAENILTSTNEEHVSDAEEVDENFRPVEARNEPKKFLRPSETSTPISEVEQEADQIVFEVDETAEILRNPLEAQNGSETSIDTLSMIQEGDRTEIGTKKVDENFERIPVEEIHPATPLKPSYFDGVLKSMERSKNEEPEIINSLEQNEMIEKMKTEIAEQTDIADLEDKTENLQKDLASDRTSIETETKVLCSPTMDAFGNDDKENEEFQKKLEEQRKIHKEELEQKRQERAEKQRKMDEEFKELRQKQIRRFCMLLQCIQLRQRFTEKEEEWSDWIRNGFRRPIEMLANQFADFREELGFDSKKFKKLLEASPETVQSEALDFQGKLELSLSSLEGIFNNLSKVRDDFEDAMFIRILQKISCEMANKVVDVLKLMDTIEYSEMWYKEVDESFVRIRANDVPGTQKLKEMCRDCNIEDYKNLEFPKWDWKSYVKIEEDSSDEKDVALETKTHQSNDLASAETVYVTEDCGDRRCNFPEQCSSKEDTTDNVNSTSDDRENGIEISKKSRQSGFSPLENSDDDTFKGKPMFHEVEDSDVEIIRQALDHIINQLLEYELSTISMERVNAFEEDIRLRSPIAKRLRSATNPKNEGRLNRTIVKRRNVSTPISVDTVRSRKRKQSKPKNKKLDTFTDLRSQLLSLYNVLLDCEGQFKCGLNSMKIVNHTKIPEKYQPIISKWNKIVKNTAHFLNQKEFIELLDSKLPKFE